MVTLFTVVLVASTWYPAKKFASAVVSVAR